MPLNELLLENNESVIKIKTLKQREEEYAYLLEPIEHTIASYYSEDKSLKDRDVIRILKNIKMNYFNDFSYFKEPLEQAIITQLSFALQKAKTTRHELLLAISYILWSIDNRAWTGDKKAYLDWILNFFGMMDGQEKKDFRKKYEKLGDEFGIDEEKIISMTASGEELYEDLYQPSKEDEAWSEEDSRYFAMSDDEKCEYLLGSKDESKKLMALKELMDLSNQYLQSGRFKEALNILNKLASGELEEGLKEVILSMRIESLICLKDYESAEKRIVELIGLNEDYPMAYFHMAVMSFNVNDLQNALKHTEESIRIAEKVDMKHTQYYQMKANILKKLGDDDYVKFEKIAQDLEKDNLKMLKKLAEENEIDMDDFEEMMK